MVCRAPVVHTMGAFCRGVLFVLSLPRWNKESKQDEKCV